MRIKIWIGSLLGSAVFAALAFQPYKPETFGDYAAEKAALRAKAPGGFLVQAGAGPRGGLAEGERQTDFKVLRSRTPPATAWYLDRLFALTDAAEAEWVRALRRLSQGGDAQRSLETYASLLLRLKALRTPEELMQFEAMVAEGIDAQRRYLRSRRPGDRDGVDWDDRRLRFSEARFAAAYAFLMKVYPDEDRHNQRAFRDHLSGPDSLS